jgi:hypothetical protein
MCLQLPRNYVSWCMTHRRPTQCLKKILATWEMLLVLKRQYTGSPNTWVYLVALLETLATWRCSLVLTVCKTCRGNCDVLGARATCQLIIKSYGGYCQIYGTGVPTPLVYVTITGLSAQQPPRRRPARADVINQHGGQGKPRQVNLDDGQDQSIAHIV